MKADPSTASGGGRTKCATCGLVNFASSDACRRCGSYLVAETPDVDPPPAPPGDGERTLGQWVRWIAGTAIAIVTCAYGSLLLTSDGLTHEQRQVVVAAVAVLDEAGFPQEAFALRHLVSYRGSDNWWNRYVGHHPAYAATNFPFAVVTLYPAFFKFPTDDIERAVILLHESHHVRGADEETTLRQVWIDKERLGWNAAEYGHTRVWKNTREWTTAGAPRLFTCGLDGQSDCLDRHPAAALE